MNVQAPSTSGSVSVGAWPMPEASRASCRTHLPHAHHRGWQQDVTRFPCTNSKGRCASPWNKAQRSCPAVQQPSNARVPKWPQCTVAVWGIGELAHFTPSLVTVQRKRRQHRAQMCDRRIDVAECSVVADETPHEFSAAAAELGPMSLSTTALNNDGRAAARPMLAVPPKLVPMAITLCRCSAAQMSSTSRRAWRISCDVVRTSRLAATGIVRATTRRAAPSACKRFKVARRPHDARQAQQWRMRISVAPFADDEGKAVPGGKPMDYCVHCASSGVLSPRRAR